MKIRMASGLNGPVFYAALLFLTFSSYAQERMDVTTEALGDTKLSVLTTSSLPTKHKLFRIDTAAMLEFVGKQKANRATSFELTFNFDAQHRWHMVLRPSRVLATHIAGVDEYGQALELETDITYDGYLKDNPTVKVRMTIAKQMIHALIMGQESFVFETTARSGDVDHSDTVSLHSGDNSLDAVSCGIPGHQGEEHSVQDHIKDFLDLNIDTGTAKLLAATEPKLGVTCDRQCLRDVAGSQANFNADLQTIVNIVNGYYAEFDVAYQLQPVVFITGSTNPWQDFPGNHSANTNSFAQWAAGNFPHTINAGLLFTGLDMGGISFAFLAHMCPDDPFRFGQIDYQFQPQSIQQRANITTHELGHIWGAGHVPLDSRFIMSPSIFDGNLLWSNPSQSAIRNAITTFSGCIDTGRPADVYCSVSTGTGLAGDDFIASIATDGIIVREDNIRVVPRADYTESVISMDKSRSTQLTVIPSTSFDLSVVAVWIDWNQDLDFADPGERVANSKGTGPYTFDITPPAGARNGQTRMRIRLAFDGDNVLGRNGELAPACGRFNFDGGETEDYSVNVSGGGGDQPAAPSNLTATVSSASQINLSWRDNSQGEDFFEIQRSENGAAFVTLAARPGRGSTSFSDTGLSADTAYRYRVRASRNGVASNFSNTASATTSGGGGARPATPTNLTATANSRSQIAIRWQDNSQGEDFFEIFRATSGNPFSPTGARPGRGSTSFVDTGLRPDTTYHYVIRASRNGVTSDFSNVASARTRR